MCARECPEVFEVVDGSLVIKTHDTSPGLADSVQAAVDLCPTGAVASLVNNAAVKASLAPGDRGLVDMDLDTWDLMMSINLRGPMLGARAVVPGMLGAGKGAIVMISSVGSVRSTPNLGTAYS